MSLNALSLFSGIGGLDLGFERAGIKTVGQVEIDPYCRKILSKHWPEVPKHDDVHTAVQWWRSEQRPRVDLVDGGFPCQPVSVAGRKLAQDDPRWLWPQMLHVVTELRPEWVVFENVPGLRTRGLDIVTGDLEAAGYSVTVKVLSACAVGAPHMRKRLFGVAHRGGPGLPQSEQERSLHGPAAEPDWWAAEPAVGRVADGVPGRVDRIRALGNAVVPQAGEVIGRLIVAAAS
jgi:DNA (cytosine-5)-methyltransferase 1